MLTRPGQVMRLTIVAALALLVAGAPTTVGAADREERPRSRPDRDERIERYHEGARQRQLERAARPERDDRAEREQRGWRLITARLMRDIELTPEQAEQVDRAFAEHREAVSQWDREHRDELRRMAGQMRALHREREPDHQEQLEALRREVRELMERRPSLEDLGGELEDVLTDAQAEQLETNRKEVTRMIAERLEQRGERSPALEMQGRDRPMRQRGGAVGNTPLFEGIELTEEQREQLGELLQARREAHAAHREALRELREQMRDAREADDADELRSLRQQLRELREDRPATLDLREGFREILDDEQWERYQANERAARERMRERRREAGEERGERRERRRDDRGGRRDADD